MLRWLERITSRLTRQIGKGALVANPFLSRAPGLRSREAKQFALRQRVERSLVTSFGTLMQELIKVLNHEAGREDIDLVLRKDGRNYYIQLKSGPQGFTRPALRKTRPSFQKLKQEEPDAVTVIAMVYGTRKQLSPIWGKEAQQAADMLLVGKEFWDFFFGKGTYQQLLKVFEQAGREFCAQRNFAGNVYDYILRFGLPKA